jgi:hypothetical protein
MAISKQEEQQAGRVAQRAYKAGEAAEEAAVLLSQSATYTQALHQQPPVVPVELVGNLD